jgi:hypothetical protein
MATKRRKIPPTRINRPIPAWAWRLLSEEVEPQAGSDGYDQWFGWAFCGESVPGLPDRLTEDDLLAWEQLRESVIRRATRRKRAD